MRPRPIAWGQSAYRARHRAPKLFWVLREEYRCMQNAERKSFIGSHAQRTATARGHLRRCQPHPHAKDYQAAAPRSATNNVCPNSVQGDWDHVFRQRLSRCRYILIVTVGTPNRIKLSSLHLS